MVAIVGGVIAAAGSAYAADRAGSAQRRAGSQAMQAAAADRETQLRLAEMTNAANLQMAGMSAGAIRGATAESARQYNIARGDQMPWLKAGRSALGVINQGLAVGGDFNRDFTMNDYIQDPGYNFRRSEGMRGLEQSAAARGGLMSGNTLRALTDLNQNMASSEFSGAYSRWNADRDRRFNRFASIANVGQTAARDIANVGIQSSAQQMQGAGQLAGVNGQVISSNNANLGQMLGAITSTGNTINDAVIGRGNSLASQYMAQGNAFSNAVGGISNYYSNKQLLSNLTGSGGINGSGSTTYSGNPIANLG